MSQVTTLLKQYLFVLASLVLLSACSSKSNQNAKQAALYFGAGTQSLMDQQYTDALNSLLKANELDPKNSEILNNLGMAYYFKGEKELAIKHLNLSLEYNENNSDAKQNLASIYFKDGNLKNAEKLYKEVLRDLTYDKQARTLYNLGMIEIQNKNNLAAEDYFQKSIKEDENYCPSYFQIGLLKYNQRQFNKALRNFKEATQGLCTNSPIAHYYQGLSLTELRRFDDARIKFDEIESRFKKSIYAIKSRNKIVELNDLEARHKTEESHATRKVLESPEF
ncbi:MAG: tetratricopeptide repeat protein [Bacteriovoracaceae bacterium]